MKRRAGLGSEKYGSELNHGEKSLKRNTEEDIGERRRMDMDAVGRRRKRGGNMMEKGAFMR